MNEYVGRHRESSHRPFKDCPLCFGTGTQHCGMATHEDGRGCGEPCPCPYSNAT